MNIQKVHIFTDGACLGNPGRGGYGIIMRLVGEKPICKEFSKGYKKTTNNRMELMAVIDALKMLKNKNLEVTVFTDSKYVSDAINKEWLFQWVKRGFKDKKNVDLWKEFLQIYNSIYKVNFEWVKGHNNHPENERCDSLATTAAKQEELFADVGFDNLNT